MKWPDWYALVILALASFRLYRLAAEDTILDRPRNWLVRLPPHWQEGDQIPRNYRDGLGAFIACPWCLGFWIAAAVWGCWYLTPDWTTGLSVPLALSALVGIVADRLI